MLDPFKTWSRLVSAALDASTTYGKLSETAVASRNVVSKRTAMMGVAYHNPLNADHAELGRMVPEKVEAFAKAGSAVAREYWRLQTDALAETQHLASLALRGLPLRQADFAALAARNQANALRMVERTIALSASTLAPIHAAATSNSRRLNRSKAKRRAK
jgi:hypothetical protein